MKYKIKKGLIYEKKSKKITIYDPNSSILIELNESAGYILNKIKKGSEQREILDALQKKYDISENLVLRDLNKFIKELKKQKILVKINNI